MKRTHSRALVALIAATSAALALAACGSSSHSTGTSADPATVVPAQSSVYLDATLRPEGSLAHDARADEKALTGSSEPLAGVVQELSGAAGLPPVRYASEVKPWVGPHAGLFLTSLSALEGLEATLSKSLGEGFSLQSLLGAATKALLAGNGVDGALVLDTSDLAKAKSFLAKLSSRDKARSASFDGVSYELDEAGGATALVGKFVVIGSEAGIKSVIETHAGSKPLASASTYSMLGGKSNPSDALLSLYLDAEPVASTTAKAGTAAMASSSSGAGLLALLPGEPQAALVSLLPQSHALVLQGRVLSASSASAAQGASEAAAGAKLVAELPSSSWLAAGTGGIGKHLSGYVSVLGTVAWLAGKSLLANFGGAAVEALAKHFEADESKLEAIFAGKAKAGAIFAGGRGLLELEAGLVVEMQSSTDAKAAVSKLATLMKSAGGQVSAASLAGAETAESVKVTGLPFVLDIGARGTRIAMGLGPGSVEAALAPPQGTLSESPLYGEASKALGGPEPAILFSVPTMLSFLEGLDLTESKSLSGVVPSLRALGTLAGGVGKPEGVVGQLKLVLPLSG
jgi:hypothetical protein